LLYVPPQGGGNVEDGVEGFQSCCGCHRRVRCADSEWLSLSSRSTIE
jgi:hypothetical protein